MPPRPQLSSPTPGSAARSSSARARSAPPSPCCSRAAASARRCRRARPSRPRGCRPTARTRRTWPTSSCPRELRIEPIVGGLARADYVFLGVPSSGMAERDRGPEVGRAAVAHAGDLARQGARAAGRDRADLLLDALRRHRVACIGGPAHAREMVTEGAGLVAASTDARLARDDRQRLHARRRRLRAVQRPDRRRARPASPRTPPRWPRARPRRRA